MFGKGKKINIKLVLFVSKFYAIKKKSQLNLSMRGYGLLKFELQNSVNSESEGKRQKIYYNFRVWIIISNTL